jgi:hypothetical protein
VKLKLLSVSAIFCLAMMITGALAGSAQQVQPLEPEWLTQMYAEGWQKIQEGVLQRETGAGEYETFTYGAEGQQWLVQSFENQVVTFQDRYNESPNEELATLIASLKAQINRLNAGMAAAEEFNGEALENCDFSFAGHAYAEYLTNTQGVTARSDASFHNNCGYTGDTFAYAYAHAIAGTVETTKIQNDPRSGGWIDSAAAASANGSTGCHSEAQATVSSYGIGINYQTPLRQNFVCPNVAPPVASISGPSQVWLDYYSPCGTATWYGSATGGTPGYTFDWYINGTYVASGASYSRNFCRTNQTVNVRVVARDAAGRTDDEYFTTNVYYDSTCYDCGGCMVYQGDPNSSEINMPIQPCN